MSECSHDHLDAIVQLQEGKLTSDPSRHSGHVPRLDEFRHVTLDCSGVDVVGQGFCDEVFRIFARAGR